MESILACHSITYLLNSNFSGLGTWTFDKELWNAVAPRIAEPVDDDDEDATDDERHQGWRYIDGAEHFGAMFMSGIYRDSRKVWRVSPQCVDHLSDPQFILSAIFGRRYQLEDVQNMFRPEVHKIRPPHADRTSNRSGKTRDATIPATEADAAVWRALGSLRPQRTVVPRGRDIVRDPAHQRAIAEQERGLNVPMLIAQIFTQIATDIMQVSPNKSGFGEGAYTMMSARDRGNATRAMFQTKDITPVFKAVHVKRVDAAEWDRKVFGRFFPDRDSLPKGKTQNWTTCSYFKIWSQLCERLHRNDLARVRDIIKPEFDKFKWLPYPESDRMWGTRGIEASNPAWTSIPPGTRAAPHLVINPYTMGPREELEINDSRRYEPDIYAQVIDEYNTNQHPLAEEEEEGTDEDEEFLVNVGNNRQESEEGSDE